MSNDTTNDLIPLNEEPELRWEEIEEALDAFREYFAEGRLPTLQMLRLRIGGRNKDSFDPRREVGVYFLFAEDDRLLYIGCTGTAFGNRLNAHEKRFEWFYEDMILIKKEIVWLGWGLERFLIDRLRPMFNK